MLDSDFRGSGKIMTQFQFIPKKMIFLNVLALKKKQFRLRKFMFLYEKKKIVCCVCKEISKE